MLETNICIFSVRQTAGMICVDLTKPEEIWFTLETLLASTRTRIESVITEMKPDNPHICDNLQRSAWERVGTEHEDRNMIDPFPVPLIIIGTKFDEFQVDYTLGGIKLIFRISHHQLVSNNLLQKIYCI